MVESTAANRASNIAAAIRIIVVCEAVVFLLSALLHRGVEIPLGITTLSEPEILPATIVETLIGLCMAASAWGLFTQADWQWEMSLGAHGFGIFGVTLGIFAIAAGGGPDTTLNYYYHRVILVVMIAMLAVLLSPAGQEALDPRLHTTSAEEREQ
jgi:hypothetical protein